MTFHSALNLLLTCEHGGNRIPREYRHLFLGADDILESHRGYDPGALDLAREFARKCHSPLEFETISRLLIELNRTLGHPRVFSEFSRTLPEDERLKLVTEIYAPYRRRVTEQVQTLSLSKPVLHLSVHSFTPVMDGKTRKTDIGLLFDPQRKLESEFAACWRKNLQRQLPELKIHMNLPYRGTSDGFTTALRKEFPDRSYAGIELEVNQKFALGNSTSWKNLRVEIVKSFLASLPE